MRFTFQGCLLMYAMLVVLTTQERTLFQAISTQLTTESQGKPSNSNDIPLPFTIVDDEGPIIIWSVSVDKLPTIQNSKFTAEVTFTTKTQCQVDGLGSVYCNTDGGCGKYWCGAGYSQLHKPILPEVTYKEKINVELWSSCNQRPSPGFYKVLLEPEIHHSQQRSIVAVVFEIR